jgi:hypothetical protein
MVERPERVAGGADGLIVALCVDINKVNRNAPGGISGLTRGLSPVPSTDTTLNTFRCRSFEMETMRIRIWSVVP